MRLVRLLVTLGLMALVAQRVDWSVFWARLRDGDPLWLGVAVGAVVVALTIGAVRWAALLRFVALTVPATTVARIYAVSTFAQSFLPTGVGGDATRVIMVARKGPKAHRALSTVLLDRAGSLAGLLTLSWAVVVVVPDSIAARWPWVLARPRRP